LFHKELLYKILLSTQAQNARLETTTLQQVLLPTNPDVARRCLGFGRCRSGESKLCLNLHFFCSWALITWSAFNTATPSGHVVGLSCSNAAITSVPFTDNNRSDVNFREWVVCISTGASAIFWAFSIAASTLVTVQTQSNTFSDITGADSVCRLKEKEVEECTANKYAGERSDITISTLARFLGTFHGSVDFAGSRKTAANGFEHSSEVTHVSSLCHRDNKGQQGGEESDLHFDVDVWCWYMVCFWIQIHQVVMGCEQWGWANSASYAVVGCVSIFLRNTSCS
jgi:hypothetical protein